MWNTAAADDAVSGVCRFLSDAHVTISYILVQVAAIHLCNCSFLSESACDEFKICSACLETLGCWYPVYQIKAAE